MKILVFGPQDRYEVYKPDFVAEMPVELVFRRPDQTYVEAARENTDARVLFVDAITPVPGGVGAVTTSVLMKHVVEAAERA